MDILIMILSCSLYPDDVVVQAVINVQSSAYVYYVGDSTFHNSSIFSSDIANGKIALNQIIKNDGHPLIGLMGVPAELSKKYGFASEKLFDPCVNISIGTAILSELEASCPAQFDKRQYVIRQYGQLLGYEQETFLTAVQMNMREIEKDAARYEHVNQKSGIFFPAEDENTVFLKDRLFEGRE